MAMTQPIRIQRKRIKGYDMQAESRTINGLECVYVGRPTIWVNPYKITDKGKNLACWCDLDQPCHADVLLELANR